MRTIQITAPGTVRFLEADDPIPTSRQILVRPLIVAICGSDLLKLHYDRPENYPQETGLTGHEMIGVIDRIGDDVDRDDDDLRPGSLALVLAPLHNAMCERFVAEPDWIFPLPDSRSALEYVMTQQLGTVIAASSRLPPLIGKTAAIVGQGSAGIFFTAFLRRLGVARIIAMDVVPERLEFSKRLGADIIVDNRVEDPEKSVADATDGKMADLVVEAAGEVSSINLAPRLVTEKGVLLFFGIPHEPTFSFDYGVFFQRYAHTISNSGAMLEPRSGCFSLAMELIRTGAIDMKGIATHRLPFDRVGDGYKMAREKNDGAMKIIIEMPGAAAYL